MADYDDAPLTEDVIVQSLFVTGVAIEVSRYVLRMVGWVRLPDLGGETVERRIVMRVAMPIDAAQSLHDNLDGVLRRGTARRGEKGRHAASTATGVAES